MRNFQRRKTSTSCCRCPCTATTGSTLTCSFTRYPWSWCTGPTRETWRYPRTPRSSRNCTWTRRFLAASERSLQWSSPDPEWVRHFVLNLWALDCKLLKISCQLSRTRFLGTYASGKHVPIVTFIFENLVIQQYYDVPTRLHVVLPTLVYTGLINQ